MVVALLVNCGVQMVGGGGGWEGSLGSLGSLGSSHGGEEAKYYLLSLRGLAVYSGKTVR